MSKRLRKNALMQDKDNVDIRKRLTLLRCQVCVQAKVRVSEQWVGHFNGQNLGENFKKKYGEIFVKKFLPGKVAAIADMSTTGPVELFLSILILLSHLWNSRKLQHTSTTHSRDRGGGGRKNTMLGAQVQCRKGEMPGADKTRLLLIFGREKDVRARSWPRAFE